MSSSFFALSLTESNRGIVGKHSHCVRLSHRLVPKNIIVFTLTPHASRCQKEILLIPGNKCRVCGLWRLEAMQSIYKFAKYKTFSNCKYIYIGRLLVTCSDF